MSLDSERTLDEIKAFGAARKVAYPLWLDSGDLASQRLRIGTLPATVVIARDGTVLWARTGVIAADDLSLNAALDLALERVRR